MFPLLFFIISTILSLMAFFSRFGWCFDLASHFVFQYFIVQLACILFCAIQKCRRLLILVVILSLINFLQIAPLYLPPGNHVNEGRYNGQRLSLLMMNLNSSNKAYGKTLTYIEEKSPDILALEEISKDWLVELSKVLEGYPYRNFIAREDNFGIGLFSKIAPDNMDIKYYGSAGVPSILVEYRLENKPLTLLFTHPVPPVSHQYYQWRNEQLNAIASHRHLYAQSMILAGDLNTTSWSYHFKNFIKRMQLVDSRKGFGLQSTWPTMLPLMSIAIDHVLVSDDIKILTHQVGPSIGSDHYPVYLELRRE